MYVDSWVARPVAIPNLENHTPSYYSDILISSGFVSNQLTDGGCAFYAHAFGNILVSFEGVLLSCSLQFAAPLHQFLHTFFFFFLSSLLSPPLQA